MPEFVCNNCFYAKNLYINDILADGTKKDDSDNNFKSVQDGHDEYFYKNWCWCSHQEHTGAEFHRMKMRFLKREECVPLLVLYQEILT